MTPENVKIMNTHETLVRMETLGDEISDRKQKLRFAQGYKEPHEEPSLDDIARLSAEINERQREMSRLRGVVSRWSRFWYTLERIVLSGAQ